MSTLDREVIKSYIRRLSQVKALLVAEIPSPTMLEQIETILDEVLAAMRSYLHPLSWPDPTADRPDTETIEEWLNDDGGCEATDGCWVEPDGTCPHGHPSWFLVLGLI